MNTMIRSLFPAVQDQVYLNSAHAGPYALPVLHAAQRFLEDRVAGKAETQPIELHLEVMEQCRAALARLINTKPEEIVFTANTGEGVNIAAHAANLGPGDNVVWDELGFVSDKLIWLRQEQTKGVENRIVWSTDGAESFTDFERLVNDRTKVVSVSLVAFTNGFRHDVRALAELAHAHGAYLCVDAIQGIGSTTFDAAASGADFVSSGTYKWLLGPFGIAFLYVPLDLLSTIEPPRYGWKQLKSGYDLDHRSYELSTGARGMEPGTPHFQGFYELRAALELMEMVGMPAIEAQVLRLRDRLWHGLADLGVGMLTPEPTRSGIVSCRVADGEGIGRWLSENRIVATLRNNEVLRFAPHFFNTEEEIDHVIDGLRSARLR